MYLNVENVSKTYKQKTAVSNINFNVEKGKILCLLGPSGCGKTTVLNAIGGFIKLEKGKIILDGINITKLPPEKRNVSTVFQSYGLFSHMNVLANIIYGLKFKNILKKEQIRMGLEMIEKIGLRNYEKKNIDELSGGEQQRVAIARSLIIKPKLLLLDEPLSNLDAKLRISMRNEIKKIQREFNITTIFVTHDQNEAFEIADTIILINKGKIVQNATPQDLYNKPKNSFALNFIGSSNKVDNYYIRPEQITVSHGCNTNINAESVVIENIIFKGAFLDLYVKKDDHYLKATVLNTLDSYKVGDTVFITYKKHLLP